MNYPIEYDFWNVEYAVTLARGESKTKNAEVVVYENETQLEVINGFWSNIDLEYDPLHPPVEITIISVTQKDSV